MKRTKNSGVIEAWKAGKPARNGKFTLSTDGRNLFSYGLHIGARTDSGVTVLADYTAGTDFFRSQTTSCHIGKARRAGVNLVMHPKVWWTSPLRKLDIPF